MFSELAQELCGQTHPLYALKSQLLADGKLVRDLVRGNPSEHGFAFPEALLAEIVGKAVPAAGKYKPDPRGQLCARESIAAHFYDRLAIPVEQFLLTPGTSISYWYCFKLLAEAGDEILSPMPSYPLLDYIARLCPVNLKYYRLSEAHGWSIDLEHLQAQVTKRTRAIVIISPHNPTGMVCRQEELDAIAELAQRHKLAIIADEVFSEFLFGPERLPRAADSDAPLVFTLNGLSKSFSLPGLKLGWIAVSGKKPLLADSLDALETISDTFLPVVEFAQFAVPEILNRGGEFQKSYVDWVKAGHELAVKTLGTATGKGQTANGSYGGFYCTHPLPDGIDEDEFALRLLEEKHILVHPGHFYEMAGNHVVFSFVQEHELLRTCLTAMRGYQQARPGNARF